MRKKTMDVDLAKKKVESLMGKELKIRYNKGRNKIVYFDGKISEFYMGSVYAEGIESCDDNFIESFADRDRRVKYYLGQHSYGVILFDKYRKRLIRIAEHPTDELGKDGIFAKPFSVIVSDMNGKLLYESPIFHDALTYDLYNIHIVPEGLAIAIQDDKNENEIRYRCIEIK